MLDYLVADRAHQHAGKTAASSGTDNHQVGVLRSIDQFPDVLLGLFHGRNTGKLILALDGER